MKNKEYVDEIVEQLEELGKITEESIKLYKIEDQLSDQEWDNRWDELRKRHSDLGEIIELKYQKWEKVKRTN